VTVVAFASVKRQLAATLVLEHGADVNAQEKMSKLHYIGHKGKKFLKSFLGMMWIRTLDIKLLRVGHHCIRHRKADIWELPGSFSSMA
jgi:hypothetical protein